MAKTRPWKSPNLTRIPTRQISPRSLFGVAGCEVAIDPSHLGGQKCGDPEHDRVRDRLRILRARSQLLDVKRGTGAEDDVAAPEATEPRLLRSHCRERDDRCVRVLRDVRDAGTCTKQLPALAPMSLRKEAQRLPCGE